MAILDKTVVWFVDATNIPDKYIAPKMKQLRDWVNKTEPFGQNEVVICISDVNKITYMQNYDEFNSSMKDKNLDPKEFINAIKSKVEDCVTIDLNLKT